MHREKKNKPGIDFDFIHGVHGKREDQHTEKVKSLTKNMWIGETKMNQLNRTELHLLQIQPIPTSGELL